MSDVVGSAFLEQFPDLWGLVGEYEEKCEICDKAYSKCVKEPCSAICPRITTLFVEHVEVFDGDAGDGGD